METNVIIMAIAVTIVGIIIWLLITKKKKTVIVNPLEKQLVVDVFDADCAKKWYTEKCKDNPKQKKILIAYLNEEFQKKLKLVNAGLNPEHYIILVVLEKNVPVEYQLVNFGSVEANLRRLLDENNGKVIIQN